MTEQELQNLALKFLKGQTTPEEEALLHSWYDDRAAVDEKIIINAGAGNERAAEVRDRLFKNIKTEIKGTPKLGINHHLSIRKRIFYAASIFLILSFAGLYFYLKETAPVKTYYTEVLKDDVGPGGNNAIFELGNGIKINLDQASNGELAESNGLIVSKLEDGVLTLHIANSNKKLVNQINTIKTPKGGQYRVKLPDGTEVWLNASSIISFPNSFSDTSREVELEEGEAYFEVAHLQEKGKDPIPFIVKSKKQKIEVLGTHFNVNNYSNEKTVKTTLLQGSVRVFSFDSHLSQLLKPGQQSLVRDGKVDIRTADIESDISWKNGDFVFNSENLHSVMRKVERWYDVEVVYQNDPIELKFSGAVSRSKNLSDVLKIMELTGKVQFKIEGRRVTVMK